MSRIETYWIAGYTVQGASDVIVNRYCRSRKQAETEAALGAVDDKARIIELGVALVVTVWVQEWKSITTTEHDGQIAVDTFAPTARSEQVER